MPVLRREKCCMCDVDADAEDGGESLRMLRELDDTTNQTWRGKRARWAALVREQAARLERARLEAMNAEGMAECMAMFRDDMIRAGVITEATPPMFMTEAILSALHKAGWRPNVEVTGKPPRGAAGAR